MRILVTGGAGFIGSHIVEVYLDAGHEVFVVDNLSRGHRENLPDEVPLFEIDIRSQDLARVFADVRPEVVNHHAAQVSVATSMKAPTEDASANVVGTVHVLEQAVRYEARKVIFASSVAVYGDPAHLPCEEANSKRPLSPYGLSKLTGERYINLFARVHGMEATVFRYGNVYGPRQDTEGEAGVIAIFVRRMLDGDPTVIDGDGLQTRDFVYVKDIARANLLALRAGGGTTLNLGTGETTTIQRLWQTVRDLTGYDGEETHGPARPGDIRHMVLSAERAREALGWQPKVSLEAGLHQTVESFRENDGGS